MAKIETLTNNWDRDNKERIERNFANLGRLDLQIMEDFLSKDPSKFTPKINGKSIEDRETTTSLNDFGVNVTAEVNGVITHAWVYVADARKLGLGIAEQNRDGLYTGINKLVEMELKSGWNRVSLMFPVEQNKSYTLFRRDIGEGTSTGSLSISGWSTHPFQSNGLVFNAGKFLDDTKTYQNYSPFFDIELITSPAQIYKLANDSVKPAQQFYVGDNPPSDAQFWFKPVGDK